MFLGYVDEIFHTLMNANKEELSKAKKELQEKTPAPMNTMLTKQTSSDALQKHEARKKMTTDNVPPTRPGRASLCQQNNRVVVIILK